MRAGTRAEQVFTSAIGPFSSSSYEARVAGASKEERRQRESKESGPLEVVFNLVPIFPPLFLPFEARLIIGNYIYFQGDNILVTKQKNGSHETKFYSIPRKVSRR